MDEKLQKYRDAGRKGIIVERLRYDHTMMKKLIRLKSPERIITAIRVDFRFE